MRAIPSRQTARGGEGHVWEEFVSACAEMSVQKARIGPRQEEMGAPEDRLVFEKERKKKKKESRWMSKTRQE